MCCMTHFYSPELENAIDSNAQQNHRMPSKAIVDILKSRDDLPNASYETINSIHHDLNYHYLPPINTFENTFANHHNQANTD